jgi:hypothetical protein
LQRAGEPGSVTSLVNRTFLVLSALLMFAPACDDSSANKPDPAAAQKAQEEADLQARLDKRKQDRLDAESEKNRAAQEVKDTIQRITVIPEGTKRPKKAAEACAQVVSAQEGFLKKFHPDLDEKAMNTQLALLDKQCKEMNQIEVALCQKFALEATTEQVKGAINDYLPACMEKYGNKG